MEESGRKRVPRIGKGIVMFRFPTVKDLTVVLRIAVLSRFNMESPIQPNSREKAGKYNCTKDVATRENFYLVRGQSDGYFQSV